MKYIKTLILMLLMTTFVSFKVYAQTETKETQVVVENIILKVKGVGCSGDANRILSNIEKQEGVSSCKIVKIGAVTKFDINYDPSVVTKKGIYAAIEDTDGCANQADKPYSVKGK